MTREEYHSVSLAGPSLPVRKYTHVEAVKDAGDERLRVLEDGFCMRGKQEKTGQDRTERTRQDREQRNRVSYSFMSS